MPKEAYVLKESVFKSLDDRKKYEYFSMHFRVEKKQNFI